MAGLKELFGDNVIDKQGNKVDLATLGGADKSLGIYFSAHWCPPCRGFTPVLKEFYEKVNKDSKVFEVVFCSNDGNDAAFERYFAEMPWTAVPYGDHRISNLKQKYGITGIPTLVIINKNGDIVSMEGRSDVQTDSNGALESWRGKKAS